MYVLPKHNVQFSDSNYWDTFFEKRGCHPFEWYGDYRELCSVLHKYIKQTDKILVVGCGNSSLSAVLYDYGYKDITNTDVSRVVIDQMKLKYTLNRPGLIYEYMDVTQTTYADQTFTCILDKGTLDSIFSDNNSISKDRALQLFDEVSRVLKDCGRYLCFTLLQDYILEFILDYFIAKNWLIRVCRCMDIEKKCTDANVLPVFSVVCTKLKQTPNLQPILEICEDNKQPRRVEKAELVEFVKLSQNSEIICNSLNKSAIMGNDGEASLEVRRASDRTTRYLVLLKDKVADGTLAPEMRRFGVFIVPEGREREWLFNCAEGRAFLREACDVSRLILIYLRTGHVYPPVPEIQKEVEDIILRLVPAALKQTSIPFLAFGPDNPNTVCIHKGSSQFSGEYVVNDVEEDDGTFFRQLIFMDKPKLIQSEVKLKEVKVKKGTSTSKKHVIDFSHICNDYHVHMFTGVALACDTCPEQNVNVLLIGLGGGVLSNYLIRLFPEVVLDVVELDPEIVDVAKKCFELSESERLNVIVGDGLAHVETTAKSAKRYDAIAFDVDNKDISSPMSCPPKSFLEDNVLNNVKQSLSKRGVFILNLACRSKHTREEVMKDLHKYFEKVTALKQIGDDINEVLLCWQNAAKLYVSDLTEAANYVKELVKEESLNANMELLDITKTMRCVKV